MKCRILHKTFFDKKLKKKGISREQTQGMFALASKEPNIAYLEEILHLVTDCGYANAYPEIFGEYKGTKIALAMDKARGGYFEKIPKRYPKAINMKRSPVIILNTPINSPNGIFRLC